MDSSLSVVSPRALALAPICAMSSLNGMGAVLYSRNNTLHRTQSLLRSSAGTSVKILAVSASSFILIVAVCRSFSFFCHTTLSWVGLKTDSSPFFIPIPMRYAIGMCQSVARQESGITGKGTIFIQLVQPHPIVPSVCSIEPVLNWKKSAHRTGLRFGNGTGSSGSIIFDDALVVHFQARDYVRLFAPCARPSLPAWYQLGK